MRDNVFLVFQLGILGGYQTQNDLLLADVAQRLETAGTVAVVLEEKPSTLQWPNRISATGS